jgi:predicted DNA binding CopG/RHH family protein
VEPQRQRRKLAWQSTETQRPETQCLLFETVSARSEDNNSTTVNPNNAPTRVIATCTGKRELFMSKVKKIPNFKTETEERAFWEKHDSSDFVDWKKAEAVSMPNLKPSTRTISLRLPGSLLDNIKIEANKRDMPYQSLIKVWLSDDVKESRKT